ncbi:hypothetical protein [Bizionia sp. M204]|uniref:hypothetical protein n=1 Tax=unclassified Bizionia TaxID=2626393 RepID=UPI00205BE26B|nr:hypothetical protein [Bizionia sp. M204]UPS90459.1 hypothetical protein GMA17_01425 [Bizionia sp. M204]
MNINQIRNLEFFQNLGKLFYAVAFADKNIVKEEFSTLVSCLDDSSFSHIFLETEFKYHVISIFNTLYLEQSDAQKCFDEFLDYKKQNNNLFSKPINEAILKMASKLAASFSGQNKSELIMLVNLSIELKKGN